MKLCPYTDHIDMAKRSCKQVKFVPVVTIRGSSDIKAFISTSG